MCVEFAKMENMVRELMESGITLSLINSKDGMIL